MAGDQLPACDQLPSASTTQLPEVWARPIDPETSSAAVAAARIFRRVATLRRTTQFERMILPFRRPRRAARNQSCARARRSENSPHIVIRMIAHSTDDGAKPANRPKLAGLQTCFNAKRRPATPALRPILAVVWDAIPR